MLIWCALLSICRVCVIEDLFCSVHIVVFSVVCWLIYWRRWRMQCCIHVDRLQYANMLMLIHLRAHIFIFKTLFAQIWVLNEIYRKLYEVLWECQLHAIFVNAPIFAIAYASIAVNNRECMQQRLPQCALCNSSQSIAAHSRKTPNLRSLCRTDSECRISFSSLRIYNTFQTWLRRCYRIKTV